VSTLLRARRPFGVSVIATGTDSVVAGVWVPGGAIITGVQGEVKLNTTTEITMAQAAAVGLEGWILPMEDLDSSVTMNALWDSHVPKDTIADTFDLDTDAADAGSMYEPGLISWELMIDVGMTARRVYHRHEIVSALDAILIRQDTETPFIEHFFAGLKYRVDLRSSIRVRQGSLLVFGVGVPDTLETSATIPLQGFNEDEWGRIKFIDHVLEQAMMTLLGLTEAGAETPWEEAAQLLRRYLDPRLLELNAGTFVGVSWTAVGELVFDIVVPGRMSTKILTGGR